MCSIYIWDYQLVSDKKHFWDSHISQRIKCRNMWLEKPVCLFVLICGKKKKEINCSFLLNEVIRMCKVRRNGSGKSVLLCKLGGPITVWLQINNVANQISQAFGINNLYIRKYGINIRISLQPKKKIFNCIHMLSV